MCEELLRKCRNQAALTVSAAAYDCSIAAQLLNFCSFSTPLLPRHCKSQRHLVPAQLPCFARWDGEPRSPQDPDKVFWPHVTTDFIIRGQAIRVLDPYKPGTATASTSPKPLLPSLARNTVGNFPTKIHVLQPHALTAAARMSVTVIGYLTLDTRNLRSFPYIDAEE